MTPACERVRPTGLGRPQGIVGPMGVNGISALDKSAAIIAEAPEGYDRPAWRPQFWRGRSRRNLQAVSLL